MQKIFPLPFLMLAACAENTPDPIDKVADPVEEEVVEELDPTPEPETDPCIPVEDAEGVRFEGKIQYPDGSYGDRSNTRIHMCAGGCLTAQWGEDGFCYPEGSLSPGVYSFKVIPYGYEGHATPLSFITIDEEDVILADAVQVPAFENQGDLVDGDFDAGNGLSIKVVADDFTPHYGAGEYVAGVSVDPVESGLPLDDLNLDKVVGMWYLGSFDAVISPLWGFQVENTGLPVGATVKIFNSSYSERKWVDAGTATVAEDGILYTDVDSGLSILSTLILIEE